MKSIPILSIPDEPIATTAQHHLPITDITQDLVLLKGGAASLVMESTALNFSLLSEKEQEAVIAAFAAFINSLSFPTQLVIRSQKKDISTYLDYLDKTTSNIKNPKLAKLRDSYRAFLLETVKKKNVLGKRFFIVIPFSPLELGITSKSFFSLLKETNKVSYPKSYVIKKAKIALYPKRDHLVRQAGRLGLKLTQLKTAELISLFHEVYNPPASALTRPEIFKEPDTQSPPPQTQTTTPAVTQKQPPQKPQDTKSEPEVSSVQDTNPESLSPITYDTT